MSAEPIDIPSVIESRDGVRLAFRDSESGSRLPAILLHGLTLTGEHVLMGSRKLEENDFRVLACDARGHGDSGGPADRVSYTYRDLADDVVEIMDGLGIERALLVGASMGFHTALRVTLDHPHRVAGVVGITPAFDPRETPTAEALSEAELTAELVRRDGVEGFIRAVETIGDPLVAVAQDEVRIRMARHRDLTQLADAVERVVRSRPFESLDDLAAVEVPVLVVASRDEFDPRHPMRIAYAYAAALPSAELRCEAEGRAPLAWSRRRLGNLALGFAETLD